MQFSGICLVTEDVAALVRFYTPIFGCQAEGDNIHAEFHVGRLNLAVFSRAGMEEMAPGSMRGAGSGNVTIAFEVEDVDGEYERLLTMGVEIIKPPQTPSKPPLGRPRVLVPRPRWQYRRLLRAINALHFLPIEILLV